MSKAVPIDVSMDFRGVATVRLSGTGETLADPDFVGQMGVTVAKNGTLTFTATQPDGTTSEVVPSGGTFAGMSSAAADIAEQRVEIDALATKFADLINSNQANGKTKAGAAGAPLLDIGAEGALTIAALDTGVDSIATADSTAENANLIALTAGRRNSGIEAGWTAVVSNHAQKVQSAKLVQESSQSRSEAADEARDQLSGVDLDREAVELMRLQQSYEAAARVLQVAREMLQSINQIGG
jgi:flagellar hook-associated protein 1 FlgK